MENVYIIPCDPNLPSFVVEVEENFDLYNFVLILFQLIWVNNSLTTDIFFLIVYNILFKKRLIQGTSATKIL